MSIPAVGRLGFGAAPIGNLFSAVSEEDAEAALLAAVQAGIRWFDVAPLYGYGLAEERLGRFLGRAPMASPILSTKVGRILRPIEMAEQHDHFVSNKTCRPTFDYSADGIQRSYEESLRRLRVRKVQILLLHDIDRKTHGFSHRSIMRQVFNEALPTLNRLKDAGSVEAIGLGINEWDVGYEILSYADVDCVLLAGRYTLLDQSAFVSGFLDACERRNVAVLAGGVFNSGFLAGGEHYDYHRANDELAVRRGRLTALCTTHGISLPAAALHFAGAHPVIKSVLVGARSAQEVRGIAQWRSAKIPNDFWAELRVSGLIPSDSPLPLAHE
jgi:D-threo-aldose 1-dehydrogenase